MGITTRKIILSLGLLVFMTICSSLQAQKPPRDKEARAAYKQATEHLLYEEWQKAVPYLEKLVDFDPENPYYNYWMGKCLFYSYKKNMALGFMDKASEIDEDVADDFHYYYGLILHYNYKFDDAIYEYKKAMADFDPGSEEHINVQTRIAQCKYAKHAMANKNPDWDRVRIRNAGDSINSEFAEHSPVISANDSILLYTARRPECLGAIPEEHYYDEDLYMSFKRGDVWSEGQNLGTPVNAKGHDATISLSADGRTLYIYRHKQAGGIFQTDFDTLGQKWKDPVKVEKPLNSKYYEACICISADGTKMIFSSDRPGGFGGRDLYLVKQIEQDKWSEPENLGPTINTPFDEDAPYFHPDNKTMYYSSNGPSSMGGFDIFVTEYAEETNKWMKPLNMGHPVNTPDEDIYFVLSADGLTGYYSSGKEGGFGEKDIYIIDFPYYPYPRRYFNIRLEGVVLDKSTQDTLNGVVRLIDKATNEIKEIRTDKYLPRLFFFDLQPEHDYILEAVVDGYPLHSEEFSAPKLYGKDIKIFKRIELEKEQEFAEGILEIQHIYYHFDKYWLRDESIIELDRVVQLLHDNKDFHVRLSGHTDWFNTVEYNQTLSWNRCNAPSDYIISQGIDAARIEFVPHSENRPIDTNEDDRGRQFNRRCEFHFVKGDSLVYKSIKKREGAPEVYVDHEPPKGLPGYDRPELVKYMGAVSEGSQPEFYNAGVTQKDLIPLIAARKPFKINLMIVDW